jgi:hypothetical protein
MKKSGDAREEEGATAKYREPREEEGSLIFERPARWTICLQVEVS